MKRENGYPVVEFPMDEEFWDDHKEKTIGYFWGDKWNSVALYDLHLRIKALEEASGKNDK